MLIADINAQCRSQSGGIIGWADDNDHIQNSIWLVSKLQDEGKVFDFMIYPGGRHGRGGPKGMHSRNEDHRHWIKWFGLEQ